MVIITGASKGIGNFLYRKFKDNDEIVYGTFNNTKLDNDFYLKKVDISNFIEVKDWVSTIDFSKKDRIILINCAGINYNSFAHKANPEMWSHVINVNLIGTFNVISNILPIMRDRNYGRIINLSSVVSEMPVVGTSAYAASKSGLSGMIKSIALENSNKGITINNINLGYFDIGMIEQVSIEFQEIIKSKIPANKFGNPDDIWNTIQYLIVTEYITGACIDLNGGII